jgi:hypothetical protein
MIQIENRSQAFGVTARAGAGLKPGMVVKLAQGTAAGDPPQAVAVSAADLADVTVDKGVVFWEQSDSQAVEFSFAPATQSLTLKTVTIPTGEQVTVLFGPVHIKYHKDLLPAALDPATVRESAKVAFDGDTGLPADYASGATDGRQVQIGHVTEVASPLVSIYITKLHTK